MSLIGFGVTYKGTITFHFVCNTLSTIHNDWYSFLLLQASCTGFTKNISNRLKRISPPQARHSLHSCSLLCFSLRWWMWPTLVALKKPMKDDFWWKMAKGSRTGPSFSLPCSRLVFSSFLPRWANGPMSQLLWPDVDAQQSLPCSLHIYLSITSWIRRRWKRVMQVIISEEGGDVERRRNS